MKTFWSLLLFLASLSCENLLGLRKVELWGDVCEVGVSLFLLPQASCPGVGAGIGPRTIEDNTPHLLSLWILHHKQC